MVVIVVAMKRAVRRAPGQMRALTRPAPPPCAVHSLPYAVYSTLILCMTLRYCSLSPDTVCYTLILCILPRYRVFYPDTVYSTPIPCILPRYRVFYPDTVYDTPIPCITPPYRGLHVP